MNEVTKTDRLFLEVLLGDQSGHWQRGDRRQVEHYLRQQPDLACNQDFILDLIYHEVYLRARHGERPQLAEYVARFPQLAHQLRDQFEVHEAVFQGQSLLTMLDRTDEFIPLRGEELGAPLPSVAGFEILEEVGRGGMGVVYKARQLGLNRLVALKMILAGRHAERHELARFRTETEAVARLHHPNIVQIYEVGEHERQPYCALEFVAGGSLAQQLKGTPLPPLAAAQLIETLAHAIHHAHLNGIIHRDLKPANILLATGEVVSGAGLMGPIRPICLMPLTTPKITDFGLAKQLDAGLDRTRTGEILGTPSYMAPEQARGKKDIVSPRTDVYSLGAILYELLTGRPPFKSETFWDTLEQALKEEPVPPQQLQSKVPRDLEIICLKCLQKEPARRYASAADLAEDLRRFRTAAPIRARPTPVWERFWKALRRRPTSAAVALVSLLLILVLGSAHYIHLRAELSRTRCDASVADVEKFFSRAETASNAGNWQQAKAQHEQASEELAEAEEVSPEDPRLPELRGRMERLRRRIDQGLTDAERLRRFTRCQVEAAACAGSFGGQDLQTNQRKTVAAVEEALVLFDTRIGGDGPVLDGAYFSEAQKEQIRVGCCELLLDLADVLAQPLPGSAAPQLAPLREALELLDQADRVAVTAVSCRRRARYLAQLGDVAAAEQQEQRARALEPTHAFEWFLTGNDLYRDGRLEEAIRHYDKAINRDSHHFGAHYALAICYLKLPGHGEVRKSHLLLARANLRHCIHYQPDLVWPYVQSGLANSELGEFEAAEADFAQALALLARQSDDTARYGVLVNRGVGRIRRHDLNGAETDLKAAVALKPDEWQAHVNLASVYAEQRRWTEAVTQLDQAAALRHTRELAAIYRSRARLHEQQQNFDAALADLVLAVRHEPGGAASPAVAEDRFLMGKLLLQTRRYLWAAAALDASLRLKPDNAIAQQLKADALLQLECSAGAVQALDASLTAERPPRPATALVYRARAEAHRKLEQHAAAAEDYTHALELQPESVACYLGRGWSYLLLEAPTLALRDFDRALQLDAANAEAYNGRAYAYVKRGHYREAIKDVEQALHLGPRQSLFLYNAARTFAQAAPLAESDPLLAGVVGADLRKDYQQRALDLLRQAVEALPVEQHAEFWQRTVLRDAALNPVRRSAGFNDLTQRFGKTAPVLTP